MEQYDPEQKILGKEDDCPQTIADALMGTEFYYEDGEGWWSAREAGLYATWEELAVRAISYAWRTP